MIAPDDDRSVGDAGDAASHAHEHNPKTLENSNRASGEVQGEPEAQTSIDLSQAIMRLIDAPPEDVEGKVPAFTVTTGDPALEEDCPFSPKTTTQDLKIDPNWIPNPVHILLMTALFEEREAVKIHFKKIIEGALRHLNGKAATGVVYKMERLTSNFVDHDHALERWAFTRSTNTVEEPTALIIGITHLTQMGNVHAAIHTQRMLMTHQPRLIFLVGICGSADPKALALGDVLIADEVHWVNVHKLSAAHQISAAQAPGAPLADAQTSVRSTPDAELATWSVWERQLHNTDRFWLSMMREFFEDRLTHLPSNHGNDMSQKTEKIVVGPLLSTNHVVDHAGIRDRHKKAAKALGLEMEAAGMLEAIAAYNNSYRRPPKTFGFCFKGVSDLAAEKKDDGWRETAGQNAAFCALSFILLNFDLIERSLIGIDDADRQPRSTMPSRP